MGKLQKHPVGIEPKTYPPPPSPKKKKPTHPIIDRWESAIWARAHWKNFVLHYEQ